MSWNIEHLIGYPDDYIGFTHYILLEDGKALLLDSGGKEYIDSKKEELFEEIKLEYIKNAFDIQDWPRMGDASRIVMEKQTKKDEFTKIKDFSSENDIKLGVVLDVLGIYLSELALPAIESINYGAKK
jgi:hypothetical protein